MSLILISIFVSFVSSAESLRSQNYDFWAKQLTSSSTDLQINALAKLAEIKNFAAIPEVQKSLSSENAEVRYHAARCLAKLPNEKSIEVLASRIPSEKDVYVKAEITRSIRSLKEYFQKTMPAEPTEDEEPLKDGSEL